MPESSFWITIGDHVRRPSSAKEDLNRGSWVICFFMGYLDRFEKKSFLFNKNNPKNPPIYHNSLVEAAKVLQVLLKLLNINQRVDIATLEWEFFPINLSPPKILRKLPNN